MVEKVEMKSSSERFINYDFWTVFLAEFQNKAHLNQIRFQLSRVKLSTLIMNGERIVLWQLKHWGGLSGSSLVRGMSTIFVTEFDMGVRRSLIGPNRLHFQGLSLTAPIILSHSEICLEKKYEFLCR